MTALRNLLGRTPRTQEDFDAIAFEAGQLFSPSKPINENDLFAGRADEIGKMLEAISEGGKHVVLFGERGVGKTSLAKVFSGMFPRTLRHIYVVREQVDPTDDFTSLWKKVFKDIYVAKTRDEESEAAPLSAFYEKANVLSVDDVRRELDYVFTENQIPIIVIDEYDNHHDRNLNELMANLLKSLSDFSVNVTVIIVGVAENINELVGEHASVQRCVEQIPMQRMRPSDMKAILDKIVPRLGMRLDADALWKIVNLSRGLPAFVHMLGLYSVQNAARRRSLQIGESDVNAAIQRSLQRSQESIQDTYAKAVHSNRGDSLYREVILACALAETDERGTFTPLSVCEPLSDILKRPVEISTFQQHLKKFITEERGGILFRRGRERMYRFRFQDPMMQPYVIMKGIEQGLVSTKAYEVLSSPAQPRLSI